MSIVKSKHLSEQEGELQRGRELAFRLVGVQINSMDFSTDSEFSLVSVGAKFVQKRDLMVYTDDV